MVRADPGPTPSPRSTPVPAEDRGALDCDRPEPPTGDFDYAIGSAATDAPEPDLRAYQVARDELQRRLCGERLDCGGLMAEVKRWTAGRSSGRVCVMATVLKSKVREWVARTASIEPLEAGLLDRARDLMKRLLERNVRANPPRAVIGTIEDLGLAGGPRAVWFADRIQWALSRAGFKLVGLEVGFDGKKKPAGEYEVLVTGRLYERREGQGEILEAALVGNLRALRETLPLEPVGCGLDALRATKVGSPVTSGRELLSDPDLVFTIDTGSGGQLCEGDKTQIYLTVGRPMHVRVFDLYSPKDGLAIFPNEQVPSGLVPAGVPLPLGGDSPFDVLLVPGSNEERFIVVAAEREDDLGPFKDLRGTCALTKDLVTRLVSGGAAAFPARAKVAETGFRVVREGCTPPPSAADRKKLQSDLLALPLCR
ncbi:MAG: hypothetical protein JNJ59_07815 [Deltaproteobacteria bacterium]|nr:hypothetical protein [Deltaproteobacteria bacterium]